MDITWPFLTIRFEVKALHRKSEANQCSVFPMFVPCGKQLYGMSFFYDCSGMISSSIRNDEN
jgi:hypothetical protein